MQYYGNKYGYIFTPYGFSRRFRAEGTQKRVSCTMRVFFAYNYLNILSFAAIVYKKSKKYRAKCCSCQIYYLILLT